MMTLYMLAAAANVKEKRKQLNEIPSKKSC
jgi:hypothetical protein